jgi:hypothetical protein
MVVILAWAALLATLLTGPGTAEEAGVAAVVTVQGDRVATLSLTVPGRQSREQMLLKLQEVSRWTGWVLGETALEPTDRDTSAQVAVAQGGTLQGSLSDMAWPLVAALASHQRVGILVLGAPANVGTMRFDNRYVTLEQTSDQGVVSYQVTVKDAGFSSLEELRRVESRPARAVPRPAGRLALAWLLLIIASAACGVTVYLVVRFSAHRRPASQNRRRR